MLIRTFIYKNEATADLVAASHTDKTASKIISRLEKLMGTLNWGSNTCLSNPVSQIVLNSSYANSASFSASIVRALGKDRFKKINALQE